MAGHLLWPLGWPSWIGGAELPHGPWGGSATPKGPNEVAEPPPIWPNGGGQSPNGQGLAMATPKLFFFFLMFLIFFLKKN
jgi:hypothetical protein